MEIWTEALSHNLPVDMIFMEYAKAFDIVPHECLIAQNPALKRDYEDTLEQVQRRATRLAQALSHGLPPLLY
ncbi:hypothetical protein Pmani_028528 [Petrolisthes manimaculis]|uniref:Uncharacterized protein n=1 Tax=Petrolisthes manimaculis TaxID=1843537 RepID=A0AAE1TY02_9EUCA|nr:hypothetical protein Pmani_028528 [Petrolisthes manimaculis]